MTLEQYIQIAILVVLAFLLWRDNRIEKRREAEKDRNLASSFNNLRDSLEEGLKSAVEEIKNPIAYSLKTYVDRTNNTLDALRQAVASLPSTQSISSILTELHKLQADMELNYDSLSSTLITVAERQFPSILTELQAIQTPIKLWGEAQANNIIKEGEANRTLRKKLQDKRECISRLTDEMFSLNSELKSAQEETAQVKAAAQTYMQQLAAEINTIRTWMDSKGMPLSSLDKALSLEFKNCVPSWEYHKALDQKELQKSVAQDAVPSTGMGGCQSAASPQPTQEAFND